MTIEYAYEQPSDRKNIQDDQTSRDEEGMQLGKMKSKDMKNTKERERGRERERDERNI